MRKAEVFMFDRLAGRLIETKEGKCQFDYDADYMRIPNAEPISPTMPFQKEAYWSDELLPFFDGLIPEGWLGFWTSPRNHGKSILVTGLDFCLPVVAAVSVR